MVKRELFARVAPAWQLASVLQAASSPLGLCAARIRKNTTIHLLRHTTTSLLRTKEPTHAGRAPLLRLPVLHGPNDGARCARDREDDGE